MEDGMPLEDDVIPQSRSICGSAREAEYPLVWEVKRMRAQAQEGLMRDSHYRRFEATANRAEEVSRLGQLELQHAKVVTASWSPF